MEKKRTLYEITGDLQALHSLMESLVDENGEPREPTEAELETMKGWFKADKEAFEKKFDGCCKFIKNLKQSADTAEAERKSHKEEMDRLSRRSKAFENRSKTVKNLLRWGMERIELKNFKTDLFSANIQDVGGKVIELETGADVSKLPEEYLKPREVNKEAILQDLKDGILKIGTEPLTQTRLFFKDGKRLPFVNVHQPTALVIR